MDRDKDAKLTYEEFVEGSKQDPTIVQVCPSTPIHLTLPSDSFPFLIENRLYRYTTVLYSSLARSSLSVATLAEPTSRSHRNSPSSVMALS